MVPLIFPDDCSCSYVLGLRVLCWDLFGPLEEDDGRIIIDSWNLSFPTAFIVSTAAAAANSGSVGGRGRRGGGSGLGLGLGLTRKQRTDKGMRPLEEYEFIVPVL